MATAQLRQDAQVYAPTQVMPTPGPTAPLGGAVDTTDTADTDAGTAHAAAAAPVSGTVQPPRPHQGAAARPGAPSGPDVGHDPATPKPHANTASAGTPASAGRRASWLTGSLLGGAAILVVLVLLLTHAFAGKNGNNNDVPLGSRSAFPGRLGSSGAAHTDADTNLSSGFSAEYSDQPFTLPGEGCTQDGHNDASFTPSTVLFTQTGPQRRHQCGHRWERARKVNIKGEQVVIDPAGPLSEANWAKQRLGRATQALPNGYCGLPIQKTCPHANKCLTWPMLITTAEFLPQHHRQRQDLLQIVSAAEARGQQRIVEMNRQVLGSLERIITGLESDGAEAIADAG